ncbi:hypothetical protein LYNGBM3L_18640 [Moorena producens 3L]|uniref:Uncharacterized protein n=1 Tax=Moorena producens 3L TaxID=489825 RepID=F4XM54_9CYAN|nr:hypothetical protein LYNGBM3L_18640 [Moorena producens 3L]
MNFAPLAPNSGGNKNQFVGKSPPKLGDLGGLNVANETSQTTSKEESNSPDGKLL